MSQNTSQSSAATLQGVVKNIARLCSILPFSVVKKIMKIRSGLTKLELITKWKVFKTRCTLLAYLLTIGTAYWRACRQHLYAPAHAGRLAVALCSHSGRYTWTSEHLDDERNRSDVI